MELLMELQSMEPTTTLSRDTTNRSLGFPTRSDTNRAVQAQKMTRGRKFWIQKVEESYYPCSENTGTDQLRSYC